MNIQVGFKRKMVPELIQYIELYFYMMSTNILLSVIPAEPRRGEIRNPYEYGKRFAHRPISLDPGTLRVAHFLAGMTELFNPTLKDCFLMS